VLKEFKAFVNQGNAVDLAVGVIIGGAFGKIVNSLVNDLIMPVMGLLTGDIDFKDKVIKLGTDDKPLNLAYGAFANTVVEFLIIAFSIFIVVRQLNKMRGEPKKA
jgi:large conductance mechanosensitive channel